MGDDLVRCIMNSNGSDHISILGHLTAAFNQIRGLVNEESDIRRLTMWELLLMPTKLQHQLSLEMAENDCRLLTANAGGDHDLARLLSVQGKGAGAWTKIVPTSKKLAFSACEFRIATRLRLNLSLPFHDWVDHCNCGASLHNAGYHLTTCEKGGGPICTHDAVVAAWSECLKELNNNHKREPRNRYFDSCERPDIVVFDAGRGVNVDLDVSLAHPLNKEVLRKSARKMDMQHGKKKRIMKIFSCMSSHPTRVRSHFQPAFLPVTTTPKDSRFPRYAAIE
jgi:hypothetical protein